MRSPCGRSCRVALLPTSMMLQQLALPARSMVAWRCTLPILSAAVAVGLWPVHTRVPCRPSGLVAPGLWLRLRGGNEPGGFDFDYGFDKHVQNEVRSVRFEHETAQLA